MLVSIIVPCYNVEAYIAECLDSALAQTYAHTEIICVDDGSSDATVEILREYSSRFPDKIKVIEGPHQGACAARNAGFEISKGEYIEFLDADDLLMPDKIAANIRFLGDRRPTLLAGGFIRLKPEGIEIKVEIPEQNPWLSLIRGQLGCTPSNLWQRKALEEIGAWNVKQKSSQEVELMFRLLKNGASVLFDSQLLTYVRMRGQDSISFADMGATRLRAIEVREGIRSHLQEINAFSTEIETAWNQVVFGYLRLVWPHRRKESEAKYRELLPKGYVPDVSPATPQRYIRLFKLLGFGRTEWLFAIKRKYF